MANEPIDPSGYVIKTESQAMTRSQVATAQRSFQEMNDSLLAVERQLLHEDLTAANVQEIAEKMVLASDLRRRLQAAAPVLQGVTPKAGNARLTDRERREIQGYYMTGNYTQEQLAAQFQVSQATVSNIVTDDEPNT
ncbi:hypothetical protein FQ186_03720 [Pseudomonas sp. ANT_H14]|uniref:sigma factor-like helix-turn-helix DNA-binding protein n=1 Tax=unclassified Pseudomonas TaxID=196821 RepID=UPI0011EBC26F|nr:MULTISPECIES: sigma factor-like helix-turn-helix DNA-binding protein [unclassified Pseudomonas]KAA0948939.1 hypothetical protein FQ182_04575 [Pseudomonas sp. ANT_H4]KAA0954283.1 hypothetical protein FQ186_03720 [Pseudomonas sp. ANT_H14]